MDSIKEIFEAMGQRIRSPFWGYVFISFVLLNWKVLFYLLFSDSSVVDKFEYFDASTNWQTLYLLPIVMGLVATLCSPYISEYAARWAEKPVNRKRIREVDAAHQVLQAKNKFAAERENEKAIFEQSLIDQAKRDEQILQIENKDIKASVEDAVTEFRVDSVASDSEDISSDSLVSGLFGKTSRELGARASRNLSKTDRSYVGIVGSLHEAEIEIFKRVDPELLFFDGEFHKGRETAIKVARQGSTLVVGASITLTAKQISELRGRGVTVIQAAN